MMYVLDISKAELQRLNFSDDEAKKGTAQDEK
jgi:hypothetical protein